MRAAVLQFLVAGALAIAWIWMLGRPLLARLTRRSRRDSVDHFRYQQSVLGRTASADDFERWERLARFHPIADWRSQPVHRRRLQILLGFALATFASMLLAVALRGMFVRLFLVMTILFTVQVLVAAAIGGRELRLAEAEATRVAAGRPAAARAAARRVAAANPAVESVAAEEIDGDDALFDDLDGAGVSFDDRFFEPIPELERLSERSDEAPAARQAASRAEPVDHEEPRVGAAGAGESTFTAAPAARTRSSRRPKARPIYIEPEPEADEGEGATRAVND